MRSTLPPPRLFSPTCLKNPVWTTVEKSPRRMSTSLPVEEAEEKPLLQQAKFTYNRTLADRPRVLPVRLLRLPGELLMLLDVIQSLTPPSPTSMLTPATLLARPLLEPTSAPSLVELQPKMLASELLNPLLPKSLPWLGRESLPLTLYVQKPLLPMLNPVPFHLLQLLLPLLLSRRLLRLEVDMMLPVLLPLELSSHLSPLEPLRMRAELQQPESLSRIMARIQELLDLLHALPLLLLIPNL